MTVGRKMKKSKIVKKCDEDNSRTVSVLQC